MPELPEVETIVQQLRPALQGRRIRRVLVRRPDLLGAPTAAFRRGLAGATVQEVFRRGKKVVLGLAPPRFLVVSLGMTGRLLLSTPSRGRPLSPHLGVRFFLDSGESLLYDDARRFGRLELLTPRAWAEASARLGPEPLDPALTARELHRALSPSSAPVRSWLLDQSRLAGVGNIYACEALFGAGIHPARRARSLSRPEAARLLRALREVLEAAVAHGGTTLRDYRTAQGEAGGFAPRLRVYGREGKGCPRCHTPVERLVLANRSAFFCPLCQRAAP